jgi:hypothetical protein
LTSTSIHHHQQEQEPSHIFFTKKKKNMTRNQNQRKPNVSILREKTEENEGEEGGYFKFYER